MKAQVHVLQSGAAEVAYRTGSEHRRCWINGCDVAGVEPLDVSRRVCCWVARHAPVDHVNRPIAIWPSTPDQIADSVCTRSVSPACNLVHGQSIAAVESNNAADLPVSDDGVDRRVQVTAELLSATDWELVGD